MTTATSRRSFLPTPDELRARADAVRKGIDPDEAAVTPDDWNDDTEDWSAWERDRERPDEPIDRELAAQCRQERTRAIILDMANDVPQRDASVNAGTPVRKGKDRSHYLAWAARLLCKRLMLRGRSEPEIIELLGLGAHERLVSAWLIKVRADLYRECKRYFTVRGWSITRIFANYFSGPAAPDKQAKPAECRDLLKQLKHEAGKPKGVQDVQQAMVVKMNGKKPWRVCDERRIPIRTKGGKPLDRGGYERQEAAQEQARAINDSIAQRRRKKPTRAEKRAPRRAEIAAKRAAKQAK